MPLLRNSSPRASPLAFMSLRLKVEAVLIPVGNPVIFLTSRTLQGRQKSKDARYYQLTQQVHHSSKSLECQDVRWGMCHQHIWSWTCLRQSRHQSSHRLSSERRLRLLALELRTMILKRSEIGGKRLNLARILGLKASTASIGTRMNKRVEIPRIGNKY
jgi:hypothetical protein